MANSAGTVTTTEEIFGSVKKIKWSFTAGSGTKVNSIGSAATSNAYNGKIMNIVTVGGASISASWDITVKNQSSVDVLMGQGASRAASTQYTPGNYLGVVANDKLTLGISGTGSSHAGTVYMYIR